MQDPVTKNKKPGLIAGSLPVAQAPASLKGLEVNGHARKLRYLELFLDAIDRKEGSHFTKK